MSRQQRQTQQTQHPGYSPSQAHRAVQPTVTAIRGSSVPPPSVKWPNTTRVAQPQMAGHALSEPRSVPPPPVQMPQVAGAAHPLAPGLSLQVKASAPIPPVRMPKAPGTVQQRIPGRGGQKPHTSARKNARQGATSGQPRGSNVPEAIRQGLSYRNSMDALAGPHQSSQTLHPSANLQTTAVAQAARTAWTTKRDHPFSPAPRLVRTQPGTTIQRMENLYENNGGEESKEKEQQSRQPAQEAIKPFLHKRDSSQESGYSRLYPGKKQDRFPDSAKNPLSPDARHQEGYMYHMTSYKNLALIRSTGLDPRCGGKPGGACFLAEGEMKTGSIQHSQNSIATTNRPFTISIYMKQRWNRATVSGDFGPIDEFSVILKFQNEYEAGAWEKDPQDKQAWLLKGTNVPPEKIQCLTTEGWVPLTSLIDIEKVLAKEEREKTARELAQQMDSARDELEKDPENPRLKLALVRLQHEYMDTLGMDR